MEGFQCCLSGFEHIFSNRREIQGRASCAYALGLRVPIGCSHHVLRKATLSKSAKGLLALQLGHQKATWRACYLHTDPKRTSQEPSDHVYTGSSTLDFNPDRKTWIWSSARLLANRCWVPAHLAGRMALVNRKVGFWGI